MLTSKQRAEFRAQANSLETTLMVGKDGVTRMLPVAAPAISTVDRAIELVPQVLDRVESFIDRKKAEKEFSE